MDRLPLADRRDSRIATGGWVGSTSATVESFLEPWQFGFMRRALVAVLIVAVGCGVLGPFIVLRRMAFVGSALAHTILPGMVFAYLRGFSGFVGALAAALLTAVAIALLARRRDVPEDTAIGVVFGGFFACGILMMSASGGYRDFHGILFGNLLGVTVGELVAMAAATGVVALLVLATFKELELATYDPTYAEQVGIRPNALGLGLLLGTAVLSVVLIQAVGVLLASALLVTPAAAGRFMGRSVAGIIGASFLVALLSGAGGLTVSWFGDVSAEASIVLVATGLFLLAAVGRSFFRRARRRSA